MHQHWFIDEIQKTWQLASKLHDGQKYGGPAQGEQIEYLNHIGSVIFEIINAISHTGGLNADLAIKCAILHDVIEDTPCTYGEISRLFGLEVAEGVLALTKDARIEGRLEKMLDSLARIKKQPKEIWAVKLADRISNLYSPPYYWPASKKIEYIKESEIILNELRPGNRFLSERLSLKIQEYYRFLANSAI